MIDGVDRSQEDNGNLVDFKCFHKEKRIDGDHFFPLENTAIWNMTIFTQKISTAGLYQLYYSNCEKDNLVSFALQVTQYNIDSDGNFIYLSSGLSALPIIYFSFTILFALCLGVWSWVLFQYKSDVKNIHYLMTSVIVFKILNLLFEGFQYQYE